MTVELLKGILCPTLTPVHADLSPDVDRWIAHCRWLLQEGCHGLCPFGTTSEANSFSQEERSDMLDQLVDAGIAAGQLMPGVGCCAIPDTVRLSAHAVRLGCAGVLMLPPFYYKAIGDEGIFRSVAEVIERVGDRRLRIYLYHIPPVAQVGFSLSLIERLITAYPQTVVGIKDSSGDWNNLHAILTRFPGFGAFTGSEKFLLETLRLGGAGSINAVNNVIPRLERRLYDHWQSAEAEALQDEISEFRLVYQDFPAIPALKQIVAHLCQDADWLHVRPPFVKLERQQAQVVVANLERLGIAPIMQAA